MEAVAYVNWGRWVADCPDPDCPNAEAVSSSGVSGLRCSYCRREWFLRFPDDVTLIEAALSVRPVPATRNWLPGETVADLLAENRAHKVGV